MKEKEFLQKIETESVGPVTVASYRRRHQLAEEVPGLYIRRLTLEDPRSAREPSSSRSQSPARHICHPTTGYVPSSRRSSSYRSWLERIRKERPPFLTIVSLELPESSIPLIESQASARTKVVETKDDVLDELLDKVTPNDAGTKSELERRKRSSRKSGRRRGKEFLECTKGAPTLEECTKNIVQGPSRARLSNLDLQDVTKCICAEISGNVRVDIDSEVETDHESRSSSPEMTHTIRIAMRQHDRTGCRIDDGVETEGNGRSRPETGRRNVQARKETTKEDEACNGVNDALDFTLNCSSVRLTCRDTSLRTGTPCEKQQRPETRN
ncbi:uncharacterized protein LOC112213377 [Bombus impatiens]|uniref:Uncharacterized protein LOC112213377 n=1 Tax=Bombus impatiens TaxID=132113 RepID=A0A6P8LYR6_BOMIM|nr:uncharacterized protein LOC112213377 [Bombus impatiens]